MTPFFVACIISAVAGFLLCAVVVVRPLLKELHDYQANYRKMKLKNIALMFRVNRLQK